VTRRGVYAAIVQTMDATAVNEWWLVGLCEEMLAGKHMEQV
jgi:hypothetical protein